MRLIPIVRIWRIEESNEGTFGALTICGQAFCVTLELPDRLNQTNLSCIPSGQYICKRTSSLHFGEVFEITEVPDRTNILFHPGNTTNNTLGCVIVAQHFGKLKGNRAVLNSGATFKKFMEAFDGIDEFTLIVREAY